ncbi:heavy metal-responsive transcriptional regulator [Marinobacteraceae bacterium S3BR75-40.1]
MRIGEVVKRCGVSADTLRYYEKIGLLSPVSRTPGGIRLYSEADLSRLRFIRRAQKMGFTLDDIASLLQFRASPSAAKPHVRQMALEKLQAVERHMEELAQLRDELQALTHQCEVELDGCPILEAFNRETSLNGQPQGKRRCNPTSPVKKG